MGPTLREKYRMLEMCVAGMFQRKGADVLPVVVVPILVKCGSGGRVIRRVFPVN